MQPNPSVTPAVAAPTTPANSAPVTLSVCIPAYNRASQLGELLESIFAQSYPHYEVVICEDGSPERAQIRAVVDGFRARHPDRIRYVENEENLGYDANFRELVRQSTGDYCFIMGNDDLVAPGAFATVADVLRRTPEAGIVLRSFAPFQGSPENHFTIARYFPDEVRFEAGVGTVVQFYRRAAVMSGIVIRRDEALALETERFDGTLFYQMYLIAHILMRRPGVIVPEVLIFYRVGGKPEFGTSRREQGRFTPGSVTPQENTRFHAGILDIARDFDRAHGTDLHRRALRDMARHSYPTFAQYAHFARREYFRIYRGLASLGYWRHPLFHVFGLGVAALGRQRCDAVLYRVRRRLGHTPSLGERPQGARVLRSPNLGTRLYA